MSTTIWSGSAAAGLYLGTGLILAFLVHTHYPGALGLREWIRVVLSWPLIFFLRSKHPKSLLCCGASDVVKTKFKVELGRDRYPDDVWYAWLNNTWTRIPPEKIVKDYAPDGQAHLFVLADTIQCFVRPKGGI